MRAAITVLAFLICQGAMGQIRISEMPITTNPSTNSFLQLSDMDEPVTKSRKYLLTNLVTQAQLSTNVPNIGLVFDPITGTLYGEVTPIPSELVQTSTNVVLDFAAGQRRWLTANTNLNFTVVNPSTNASITLEVLFDSTNRWTTFPDDWRAIGSPKPTIGASNTISIFQVWISAFGTNFMAAPGF